DGPGAAVDDDRLRVHPVRRAGGRVARVPDGDLPAQAPQRLLVEHLGYETELTDGRQPPVLRDRDARGLLAAVLEREQAEVRETGNVTLVGPDPEHATHQSRPSQASRNAATGSP